MKAKIVYFLSIVLLCCAIEQVNLCQSRSARTPTTDGPPRLPFFRLPYMYYPTLSPLPYGYGRYRRSIDSKSDECGRLSDRENVSETASWPWLATIYVSNVYGQLFPRCSGSLVAARSVLTSAFCFNGLDLHNKVFVSFGIHKIITNLNDTSLHEVESIKIHSGYLQDSSKDIALVVLTESVKFSDVLLPICLPNDSLANLVYNKYVNVVGWSYKSTKNTTLEFFPNKKQQSAKLRIKNGSPICNNSTNNPANNNRYCAFDDINISNKQFEYECIYSPLGSPLMIYSNGIWYVYGISTWYDPSSFVCVAYNPSYYTMVPNYIDWIDYNIIS